MTLLSRILGFVRDMIIARVFGAEAATDVFFVAFKIPNFLRRLFGEGAFSQAFVPMLAQYKVKDTPAALKEFVDRTAGTLALILVSVTAIGVIGAPVLVWVFAPGFAWNESRYDLAVELLRITFPYLFFMCSAAFAGAVMNTFGRYAVPAFTPVLLNVCMIAAAVWFAPRMNEPVLALAWAVFAAGAIQLLFQFPTLWNLGLLPRLKSGFHDPAVRRTISSLIPTTFGVSVTQINLLSDTMIASFLATGSVSWLYYSDRLVEFPLGFFGIALATVILPTLSRDYTANDADAFSNALDWGLKWVILISFPATLGLIIMAEPILTTLYQYDEYSRQDVIMTGRSLVAYSAGLLPFMLIKVLLPGFTSRQDIKTPVQYGLYSIAANLVLKAGLVFPFAHAGLALATSLAALLNAMLLLRKLQTDNVFVPLAGWRPFLFRVVIANIAMATVLWWSFRFADWPDWNALERFENLGLWITAGGGVYVAALFLLGLRTSHLAIQNAVPD